MTWPRCAMWAGVVDDDVLGKRQVPQEEMHIDGGLAPVRPVRHDDQEVDIAQFRGIAARARAEQHDALRLEPTDDAVHHGRNSVLGIHEPSAV